MQIKTVGIIYGFYIDLSSVTIPATEQRTPITNIAKLISNDNWNVSDIKNRNIPHKHNKNPVSTIFIICFLLNQNNCSNILSNAIHKIRVSHV